MLVRFQNSFLNQDRIRLNRQIDKNKQARYHYRQHTQYDFVAQSPNKHCHTENQEYHYGSGQVRLFENKSDRNADECQTTHNGTERVQLLPMFHNKLCKE